MQPASTVKRRLNHHGFALCLAITFALPMLPLWNSIARHRDPIAYARPAIFRVAEAGPQSSFPNRSVALMLVLPVAFIGVRLRSYVHGRQHKRHLEIARRMQASLLPPAQRQIVDGLEIAADCLPSSNGAGGFYDTFAVPGGGSTFVLGDVCGSGIPAALLMGVLHGAVRSSAWTDSGAGHEEATSKINRVLCELTSAERAATMFWSYFDPQSNFLRYINAGHFPPLLFKANRRDVVPLRSGGPVLGVAAAASYQQASARFDPGDLLVIYSAGIVQARDRAAEMFGRERLLSVVGLSRGKTAHETRDRILSAVQAFTGDAGQDDDRTLLVIRYTGPRVNRAIAGFQGQPTLEIA